MKAIFGLGNPGDKYKLTRHNIGFMAIEKISELYSQSKSKTKFNATYYEVDKNIFVMPQTYMNNSGIAVQQFCTFFKIQPQNIIVIHDDIDLEVGRVKAKIGGGHGGHNGLRSIDQHIGNNYARIRLGVGRPSNGREVSDFVLQKFDSSETQQVDLMIEFVSKNIMTLVNRDISVSTLNDFIILRNK